MTGDHRDDAASEARDLVRRAVGDAAGLTVKGQIRRAVEHLGYGADGWRVREAWYGRAGRWCAGALHDLRLRLAAWHEKERARARPDALAQRLGAVQRLLGRLQREVDGLEVEVGRVLSGGREMAEGGACDDA